MTEYQKYQLQWMIDHGYSIQDLIRELRNYQYDDPEDSDRISAPIDELFNEWEQDVGFDSEIWVCEDEWKNCEGGNSNTIENAKTELRMAISHFCRWRVNAAMCNDGDCDLCPVNSAYDMARDDSE